MVEPSARDAVLAEHDRFGDRVRRCRVVALAAVGRHRLVKVRLDGARMVGYVQLRFVRTDAGWRIGAAELVRMEPVDVAPAL